MNFAPGCRTESMIHSPTVARVLDGMQNFAPLLVLEAPAAAALMAILLLSDLSRPKGSLSASGGGGGDSGGDSGGDGGHPWELLSHNSFHGGSDRCPFDMASIGSATWLLGNVNPFKGTAALVSDSE